MTNQVSEELFRGEEVAVRLYRRGGAVCIITFDNHQSDTSLDRRSFGEEYCESREFSAIHVLSRTNIWYQHPEMIPALAAVKKAAAEFDQAIGYGSSMGAYAAIRFADQAGATAVVALSPQYSIKPEIMPQETRWDREAKSIAWTPESDGPITCGIKPVVFYDPIGLDGDHVDLIRRDIAIDAVPIRYSGHPIASYLQSYIAHIIPMVIHGEFDSEAVRRYLHSTRRDNYVYFCQLADHQPAHRPRMRVKLAERAVELTSGYQLATHTLALALVAAGDYEGALPWHKRAVDESNGHLGFLIPYGETLEKAGRIQEAIAVAERAVAADRSQWILNWLFRLEQRASWSPTREWRHRTGRFFTDARHAVSSAIQALTKARG